MKAFLIVFVACAMYAAASAAEDIHQAPEAPPGIPDYKRLQKGLIDTIFHSVKGHVRDIKPFMQIMWGQLKLTTSQVKDMEKARKSGALKEPKTPEEIFKGVFRELEPECFHNKSSWFYRQYDGKCNWLEKGESEWGSAGTPFIRDSYDNVHFAKGSNSEPREGPNVREVSNAFFGKNDRRPFQHTGVLIGFIELVMHDLMQIGSDYTKPVKIPVPKCDKDFDPNCTGKEHMTYYPAKTAANSGKDTPTEYINHQTSWADLSALYGASEEWGHKLRTHQHGKLKAQYGKDGREYMPFNTMGLPLNGPDKANQFAGGDERANQDWMMVSIQTLLLREHNRLCDIIVSKHPDWDDERIFQTVRLLVFTKASAMANAYAMGYYTEKMRDVSAPANDGYALIRLVFGTGALVTNPFKKYPQLYQGATKPSLASYSLNIGYRFHDLIPAFTPVVNSSGHVVENPTVEATAFNSTGFFEHGLENILRGMVSHSIPDFHTGTEDQFRNSKYDMNSWKHSKFDLAAWSILRERYAGMPTFNEYFKWYMETFPKTKAPCPPRKTFEEFTSNPEYLKKLKELYKTPDDVDFYVGLHLDETFFPATVVPTSQLITALYALFKLFVGDRFTASYALLECVNAQKFWDCTPSNALSDLLWKPAPKKLFPRFRTLDTFWVDELGVKDAGHWSFWKLVIDNTGIQCLQQNPIYVAGPHNPIVCSCGGKPCEEFDFDKFNHSMVVLLLSIISFGLIVYHCVGSKRHNFTMNKYEEIYKHHFWPVLRHVFRHGGLIVTVLLITFIVRLIKSPPEDW